MSLFGRLLRGVVNLAHPRDPGLARMFAAGGDVAGVTVNETTAMGVAGVFAAVNVIAETIASAPLHVYRRAKDGSRDRADDHPLHAILHDRPCAWMTSFEWREGAVRDACLHGDALFEQVTDAAGRLVELRPLAPWGYAVQRRDDGSLRYVMPDGRVLLDDEVLRLPYKLGRDGRALSPLDLHRHTFGVAIAARRHQAAVLGNAAQPKGALEIPTVLKPEDAKLLREDWERKHGGPDNAGRVAILDGGMTWKQIGMSNEDAQFVEMVNLTLDDIARIYRVPPHKIAKLDRATFGNIERQSIEFVRDTILPWARRHEERFNGWLLRPAERREFFVAYDLKGFLRGDAKARAEFYRQMFYVSAISPNEIRKLEDLAPIGPEGDRYFVQGATVPVDMLGRVAAGDTPRGDRDEA